jgi:putative transcriptional regulator
MLESEMKKSDFDGLLKSLKQARRFAAGKPVKGMRVHIPSNIDVARIRQRMGLTQSEFSSQIGVTLATVRNWEQGRRMPEGPARVLLAIVDKDPGVVRRTLE